MPMIFIAGGTGFVGGHLLQALKKEGRKVRCLVRSEEKAELCKSLGFESRIGDITDRESLKGALEGVSTVIHLVGIIEEDSHRTFEKVHVKGTENLVEEAEGSGVKLFFYQSALGAAEESPSGYQRTKATAEDIVRAAGMDHLIFRPSLIIGKTDGFSLRMRELIMSAPMVPVPGDGMSRFQPLYILDWVKCLLTAIDDLKFRNRTLELGGPEQIPYNDLLTAYMKALGKEKTILHIPVGLARIGLPLSGLGRALGLKIPRVSAEQLDLLQHDNITDPGTIEREFGFKPRRLEEYLPEVFS